MIILWGFGTEAGEPAQTNRYCWGPSGAVSSVRAKDLTLNAEHTTSEEPCNLSARVVFQTKCAIGVHAEAARLVSGFTGCHRKRHRIFLIAPAILATGHSNRARTSHLDAWGTWMLN